MKRPALLLEGGACDITGRIKDMVIRGGENVYLREIDEFPMTVTGKVRKIQMRQEAVTLLGPD